MELRGSCRQDERSLDKDKQALTITEGKVWGSYHKLCLLGMNIYFNIHGHLLIIGLPCYSAFLSFPILIFFPLYFYSVQRKLKHGKQK